MYDRALVALGAYGRQYTTEEAVLEDWNGGKDFWIYQGCYCSIRDKDVLAQDGYTCIRVVYGQAKHVDVPL